MSKDLEMESGLEKNTISLDNLYKSHIKKYDKNPRRILQECAESLQGKTVFAMVCTQTTSNFSLTSSQFST
jgi:hypothetical protein